MCAVAVPVFHFERFFPNQIGGVGRRISSEPKIDTGKWMNPESALGIGLFGEAQKWAELLRAGVRRQAGMRDRLFGVGVANNPFDHPCWCERQDRFVARVSGSFGARLVFTDARRILCRDAGAKHEELSGEALARGDLQIRIRSVGKSVNLDTTLGIGDGRPRPGGGKLQARRMPRVLRRPLGNFRTQLHDGRFDSGGGLALQVDEASMQDVFFGQMQRERRLIPSQIERGDGEGETVRPCHQQRLLVSFGRCPGNVDLEPALSIGRRLAQQLVSIGKVAAPGRGFLPGDRREMGSGNRLAVLVDYQSREVLRVIGRGRSRAGFDFAGRGGRPLLGQGKSRRCGQQHDARHGDRAFFDPGPRAEAREDMSQPPLERFAVPQRGKRKRERLLRHKVDQRLGVFGRFSTAGEHPIIAGLLLQKREPSS